MARKRLLQSVPVVMGTPVRYLLRDDFNDTVAAGSVNGTACTPGPGTRAVVDTAGTLLSVSGGNLVASGRTGTGDPGLWINNTVARTAGRFVIAHAKLANILNRTELGWDNNTSGVSGSNSMFLNGSSGILCQPATHNTYTHAVDKDYYFAIVLKSTGAYYLLKQPTDLANWTLLWIDYTDADDPVYPFFGIRTAWGSGNNTCSFIRVPVSKWLPVPAAYDTFTRANGALGSSETTGPDSQTTPSLAWTSQVGTVEVSSNAAKATALSGDRAIATVPTGKSNVYVRSALTRGTTSAGIVLRYEDSDNYLYVIHNGTNLQFYKRVAGVETPLVDTAATYVAGAPVRCLANGTNGTVFYNNAIVSTTQTVPTSTFSAHGLIFFDTDSTMDTFSTFPRGTGGEYDALNRYIR